MFERFLINFLESFLGKYVDVQGFDQSAFELSAWKGTVEFENLVRECAQPPQCTAFVVPACAAQLLLPPLPLLTMG